MTRDEARRVLLLYRPGTADAQDAEIQQALALAEGDEELGRWLKGHIAFQDTMRLRLREMPVPASLRAAILTQQRKRPKSRWWPPAWLMPQWLPNPAGLIAATAALIVVFALTATWFRPRAADRFSNFQARVLSTALREYRMDIVTNDMSQVRQFMAAKGAPADYRVAKGLQSLTLTGGGLLRWRNNPVAMVCFDRGDGQMLFMFVMNRSALKDPPPENPRVSYLRDMNAASWTKDDKVYLLAGPEEENFQEKYLGKESPNVD